MSVRDRRRIVMWASALAALLTALAPQRAMGAAASETAKADAARKKPLQRCDQLSDKAQIECLQKARERVVQARQKRESASMKAPSDKTSSSHDTAAAGAK